MDQAARLTARATLLSVACASVLIVIKLVTWRTSGSVATLASLADSIVDLLASLVTFAAVRYAAAPPDEAHRYGHGKAEAFASLIQAGLVFASAALVGQEAIGRILHPEPLANETWAMAAMGSSTVLTILLVWAQTKMLAKAHSVAVSGDRAHYLVDVASNIAALTGIGLAYLIRQPWLDAAAGLVVATWLVWGAVGVFREAAFQLMDHELAAEARRQIRDLVRADARIVDIHDLRTRASGPYVHIQMHCAVPATTSLVEAHEMLVAAEKRVLKAFPAADILMHVDPHGHAEPHAGAFATVAEGGLPEPVG